MKTLVFLLEEPSAQDLLEGLLPRLIPNSVAVRYLVFEGKQDLEKRMVRMLRGWLTPNSQFVVLRDQDSGDCKVVKKNLVKLASSAGKSDALVRVACRELESWILGDLDALAGAYDAKNVPKQRYRQRYRNPDKLGAPVAELRKLVPTYQKRDGARRLGVLLDPERNASTSFKTFCSGVRDLVGDNR